ncbi:MAG: alpha/beta fold hydrolase [Proteobacteria bacterium]|nr:alpha/beta fold hydrolase [Pseudomonadota bacterium]
MRPVIPRAAVLAVVLLASAAAAGAGEVPAAVYRDPPRDRAHPASMAVLHVPSGGVEINGVAYLPAGAGPHPAIVICHGLPGNEKNLDLAQAVRRAGWTAVTFNYRGSWGSPGRFSFMGNLDDAAAVLAYLRDPGHARELRIDPSRIVIAGHSMGGWVAAMTGARDGSLAGTILISAWDPAAPQSHEHAVELMADNHETLAGVTPEDMAAEREAHVSEMALGATAAGLATRPLLVLSSDDGLAPGTDALVAAARAHPGARVTAVHVATDHGWSDRRISLESAVIRWLGTLR